MFLFRLPFYVIFCSVIWGTFLWVGSHNLNLNSIELENSLFGWILCVLIVVSIISGIAVCVVLPIVACIKFEVDWKDDLVWDIRCLFSWLEEKFKEIKK